jgi:uncharacterized protein YlaN (UPF0358 family)
MTYEQLERAEKLTSLIEQCKDNLKKANYTQYPEVVELRSYFHFLFYGIDGNIEVPETLFRTIGKLIISELEQKLSEYEKEFNEL